MVDPCWVWEYMIRFDNAFGDLAGYKCKSCGKIFSKETGSSSLGYHLIHSHKLSRAQENSNEELKQTTLDHLNFPILTRKSLLLLNKKLTLFIASKDLPISIVESLSFKQFCEQMNASFVLPTYEAMRNLIVREGEDTKFCVKNALKATNFITLSCDLWTSLAYDPYIGINAHY